MPEGDTIYRRSGRPCVQCGTAIRMRRQGSDARFTYFYPSCQAVTQAATRTPDISATETRD